MNGAEQAYDVLAAVRNEAPEVVRLATAVSIASRIEPLLLRRARLDLCHGMEAGVEIELWHSPLTQVHSPQVMVLRPEIATQLQAEFRDRDEILKAYTLIAECHESLPEAIRLEEEITWRVLADEPDAADRLARLLRKATNSLVEGRTELADWVARFLSRAPERVRRMPEAWVLGLAASSRLGGVRLLAGDLPPGVHQDELFWALSTVERRGTLFIGRDGTDLLLSLTPPREANTLAHSVPIPLTDPIVIELDDRSGAGPRLHAYGADASILRIPMAISALQLRTAAGDVYEIVVPTAAQSAGEQAAAQRAPDRHGRVFQSPFPGLRPFDMDEAPLFFGRAKQAEAMRQILMGTRFLAVIGPSGSGKSSLVRAGLVYALHGGSGDLAEAGWRVAMMRPGLDPMESLAGALSESLHEFQPRTDDREGEIRAMLAASRQGIADVLRNTRTPLDTSLLLFVEQFEEIFLGSDEGTRERFIELLLSAFERHDAPVYIVISLRDDFVTTASNHERLVIVLKGATRFNVPPFDGDELRDVVVRPLEVVGGEIEPALVDALMSELLGPSEIAPLQYPEIARLQHTLRRLWDLAHAPGSGTRRLTLEAYHAIGGIRGALERQAEEAFSELDGPGRSVAEAMFRRLTDGDETRPVQVSEIHEVAGAPIESVEAVADVFRRDGRGFLMPPPSVPLGPDTALDIASPLVIRAWKRLREWIGKEQESARIYRRLLESALQRQAGRTVAWTAQDQSSALAWRQRDPELTRGWASRYGGEFDLAMSFLGGVERDLRQAASPEKQTPRQPFDYLYYVSYARQDRDKSLERFLDLLGREVQQRSGNEPSAVSFVDQSDIMPGERWMNALIRPLQRSATMVSILSPSYFASRFTGKEFAYFLKMRGQQAGAVVPVVWIPPRTLPAPFADLQLHTSEMPEIYRKEGARALTAPRRERLLKQTVSSLAEGIVTAAERVRAQAPAAENPPDFDSIPSAWPTETAGPKHVQLMIAAGGVNDMTSVRQSLGPYGQTADEWRPFFPDRTERAVLIAQKIAAEADITSEMTTVSTDVQQRLDEAANVNSIALVIVDGWALMLAGQRQALGVLDRRVDDNRASIVVLNEADDETKAHRSELEAAIRETFQHLIAAKTPTFFLANSPNEFEVSVREALHRVRERIMSNPSMSPMPPVPPFRGAV